MSGPDPNRLEHELTQRILYGMPSSEVARQLAAVREGMTLEGPRSLVGGTATLPRHVIEGRDRERGLELAADHAWRSWFGELRRRRLRPCGWPAEDRVKVRSPQLVAGEHTWIELENDDETYEYLVISVTCEAVPMT